MSEELSADHLRAQLELQEAETDRMFVEAINAVCAQFKRQLQPAPVLLPGTGGMVLGAEIRIARG